MNDSGDQEVSGIDIDQMTLDELRDNFIKLLPEDAPGKLGDRLDPEYMKRQYEKLGLNRQNPSMYQMVCWLTNIYNDNTSGTDEEKGLSFEDFI